MQKPETATDKDNFKSMLKLSHVHKITILRLKAQEIWCKSEEDAKEKGREREGKNESDIKRNNTIAEDRPTTREQQHTTQKKKPRTKSEL